MKFKMPMYYPFLLRRVVFILAIFIGISSLILLARSLLEHVKDRPITNISIGTSVGKDQEDVTAPEKGGTATTLVSKEEAGATPQNPIKAPGLNQTPPPAVQKVEPTDISPTAKEHPVSQPKAFVEKPTVPASSRKDKKKPMAKATIKKPPPLSESSPLEPAEKDITVQNGDSLYSIAAKFYHIANTSIIEKILIINPKISHPRNLPVNMKIKIPKITEESLVIKSAKGLYLIRLGTFLQPQYSDFLKAQSVLKGKEILIDPWKTPFGETWYRVVAGNFDTQEESLKTVQALRQAGLSPYFAGFKFRPKN